MTVFFYGSLLFANENNYHLVNSKTEKAAFYIFADPTSCFTCLESINYYYNLVKNHNVKFILFFNGVNNINKNEFQNLYKWDFEIISDPVGAYSNYYNVSLLPVFIIFDKRGNKKLVGKCGGTDVSDDEIINALKYIDDNDVELSDHKFIEIKRFPLTNTSGIVTSTRKRFLLYSRHNNNYLLANSQMGKYQIFDSLGNQINEIDLEKLKMNSYFIFKPVWVDQDSVILGINMDEKANRILYKLNIYNSEYKTIENSYFDNDELGWNKGLIFYYNPENDNILGYIFPLKSRKLNQNDSLLILIDENGSKINQFHIPNKVFESNNISFQYSCYFDRIPKHGYLISVSPYDYVYLTDFKGDLLKEIKIDYDTTFKYIVYEEKKRSLPEMIDMNLNVSSVSAIQFDDMKNINILYFSRVIEEIKNRDISISDIRLKYYLTTVDLEGNRIRDKDIGFPVDLVPFYINGDIVIASDYKNNSLDIVWLRIIK